MNMQNSLAITSRQWKNEAGYSITLRCNGRRSRVEIRDGEGSSLLYHEFEYWQQGRAEQEAETLALLAHAVEMPAELAYAA